MEEIGLVRFRLAKLSQEAFDTPSEIDQWETPTVVMEFIRRVPAITPEIMAMFKDRYNSVSHLRSRPNGVHAGIGTYPGPFTHIVRKRTVLLG